MRQSSHILTSLVLSELVYMKTHGWKNGVSQTPHTKWIKDMQRPGGGYESKFTDQTEMQQLLSFGYNLLKSVPKQYKSNTHLPPYTGGSSVVLF